MAVSSASRATSPATLRVNDSSPRPGSQQRPGELSRNGSGSCEGKGILNRTLSASQYADAVNAHAKLGSDSTLYPGHNFKHLAHFLRRATLPSSSQSHASSNIGYSQKGSLFAQLYKLSATAAKELEEFGSPEDLARQQEMATKDKSGSAQILFLRGQPSSKWLATVGAVFLIDPEFFRRYLDFRFTTGSMDLFTLPSLPSTLTNVVQLRFMTIGKYEGTMQPTDQQHVETLRTGGAKSMKRYFLELSSNMDKEVGLGRSIVRGYYVHDESYFTLEQKISVCISSHPSTPGGWTIVVCHDTGDDLSKGPRGPWFQTGHRTSIYPTIQTHPWVALKSHQRAVADDLRPMGTHTQSSALLSVDYGRTLNQQLMTHDPFYALSELFLFAAFSQTQFLNLVESKVFAEPVSALPRQQTWDHSNVLYHQELLEAHATHLREVIEIIKVRGGPMWSVARECLSGAMQQHATAAAQSMQKDYEYLLARTEGLCSRCKDRMNVFMNRAVVAESEKAMLQAVEVTKLTRLAFVYIPLSFTASFFGMNLTPLNSSASNSLWLWVAVTAPVLIGSLLALKWNLQDLWQRLAKQYQRKFLKR